MWEVFLTQPVLYYIISCVLTRRLGKSVGKQYPNDIYVRVHLANLLAIIIDFFCINIITIYILKKYEEINILMEIISIIFPELMELYNEKNNKLHAHSTRPA